MELEAAELFGFDSCLTCLRLLQHRAEALLEKAARRLSMITCEEGEGAASSG
jgi:hypothetical protein